MLVFPQSVSDEQLARLFRRFPGMEYCDLKKDRTTGRSKVRDEMESACLHVCIELLQLAVTARTTARC